MTDKNDDLGDRMKAYEFRETGRTFLPGLPIYARIDGRCFSKFTNGMKRPYDPRMIDAMVQTTKHLVKETHAKIGYVQSDEISLVWHAENTKSSVFFEGKIQKMASVLAGMATAAFMSAVYNSSDKDFASYAVRMPHFDARVIQLPSKSEAVNMFVWRNLDATKNAISMAARHYYSHKELHGRGQADMQEMLFAKGINFNDYPPEFKRGTWVCRKNLERSLSHEELMRTPETRRPNPDTKFVRTEVQSFDMPKFSSIENKVEVIFDGSDPKIKT